MQHILLIVETALPKLKSLLKDSYLKVRVNPSSTTSDTVNHIRLEIGKTPNAIGIF